MLLGLALEQPGSSLPSLTINPIDPKPHKRLGFRAYRVYMVYKGLCKGFVGFIGFVYGFIGFVGFVGFVGFIGLGFIGFRVSLPSRREGGRSQGFGHLQAYRFGGLGVRSSCGQTSGLGFRVIGGAASVIWAQKRIDPDARWHS